MVYPFEDLFEGIVLDKPSIEIFRFQKVEPFENSLSFLTGDVSLSIDII